MKVLSIEGRSGGVLYVVHVCVSSFVGYVVLSVTEL